MKSIDTLLFPYPHIYAGQLRDGSILSWPATCRKCKNRQCENTGTQTVQICSYGYDFLRASDSIVIGGILVKESPASSSARKKRLRSEKGQLVARAQLERAIASLQALRCEVLGAIEEEKKRIIAEYVNNNQYLDDFLSPLRKEIQRGLSFVHDYKQINTVIAQNFNVILQLRYGYGGATDEELLSQASQEEKAVYYASQLLNETWIRERSGHAGGVDPSEGLFRPHGALTAPVPGSTKRFLRSHGAKIPHV